MKIGVGAARRLGDGPNRGLHLGAVDRIALERDDAGAAARDRLLERRLHHRAIGVVGDRGRERRVCPARPHSRRCDRRRTPAGSSADRRRAPPRWRRSRTRSPGRCASARAAPTGVTESANSGPRMISAPSSSACWAACWAPGALPPSSLTRSCRSGTVEFGERHLGGVAHGDGGDARIAGAPTAAG